MTGKGYTGGRKVDPDNWDRGYTGIDWKRKEPRMKIVEKDWGVESWIHNGEYCIKELSVSKGWRCSMHMHPVKDETFYCASGLGLLERGDHVTTLQPGSHFRVKPFVFHRFWARTDMILIEASTHHDDEDVVRAGSSSTFTDERLRERLLTNKVKDIIQESNQKREVIEP